MYLNMLCIPSLKLRMVLETISLVVVTFYLMCTYPDFAFVLELLTSANPVGFQPASDQVTG